MHPITHKHPLGDVEMTIDLHGYGAIVVNGKLCKAHRISYLLTNGTLDESLGVLHKCDNNPCIRPDHIYQGTQQDNMADMFARGRNAVPAKGEKIVPAAPPKPCINCGRLAKPLDHGRCHACGVYLRNHGVDITPERMNRRRPYESTHASI